MFAAYFTVEQKIKLLKTIKVRDVDSVIIALVVCPETVKYQQN